VADYNGKPQIFIKRGMNITLPGDRLTGEWFQYIQNVRSYLAGEWRQRPGMTSLGVTTSNEAIYHITRINDNLAGTFRRLVATSAGNVYIDNTGHTTINTSVDSGFSGKKYSSIISRPDRSPKPFLFLASDTRNSKFSTTGSRTEWGIAAPLNPPTVETQGLSYVLVDNCNATTGFSAGGAGATLTATANNRVNTTLTAILYNTGSTGIASIVPGSSANINAGMLLTITQVPGSAEETIVDEVYPAIATTTIAAINYDSGSTGPCTIVLTAPTTGLQRNSIIRLNSSEYVRVLSVTIGPDGIPSLRASTSGTFSATQAVTGHASFRCSLDLTHNTSSTITSTFLSVASTAAGLVTVSKTAALNLASANISEGGLGTNRPIQSEDFLHIGIRGRFEFLTEVQIRFDIDSATNDFTRNYFFIVLRQPDLQGVIGRTQQAISAQQTQIQRDQIDAFVRSQLEARGFSLSEQQIQSLGDIERNFLDSVNTAVGGGFFIGEDNSPVSLPGDSGDQQWTELFLPITAFQRVGTDDSRTWANVAAFQISFQTTSAVTYGIDDIWVGGTHGPDTHELPGYMYVFRARNTTTGTVSNPSPPTRSPNYSRRRLINITVPTHPDGQVDMIDIFRIGGNLQDYHLIGSRAPNGTFNDDISDSVAMRNPIIQVDRFKPWPRPDLPKSGTCNVVGTTVIQTGGDTFSTAWVRGTQIIISGKVYSFYTNPTSTTRVEINENGGNQTGVAFQITEPLLDSQPLPAVFGPYSGASGEFFFAVGDPTNPGFLVWTNGNDPESSSDVNFLELCSPSEKLMNGCVLDGIVFCFSDKRSWRILPSFTGGQSGGGSDFYPADTSMGKGLMGRWCVAVGDAIYFASFDGIYRSRGDAVEDITTESLAPLFRRDGANTNFSAPVSPISFATADEDEHSLVYSFDGLYFTYKGLDGNYYTFYHSFLTKGWVLDTTSPSFILRSAREIRSQDADNVLVGRGDGRLLIRSNSVFSDNSIPISCRVWDREEIWDDLRSTKQVGDVMVDVNPNGATISPTMRYENNSSNDVLTNITGSSRDQYVRDVNSGAGRIVRGAALDLTWANGTSANPAVYAWQPAAFIKAEESVNRATDWDNGGYTGTKWLQGFRLRGDTLGLDKSFRVEIDGGTFVESFTFNANGEQVKTFWLTNPVVAHEMRMIGTDSDLWRNMGIEWIFEPEPELAAVWETQVTSFDLPFFSHMREVMIAHRSTADITMTVVTDGASNSYTIPNGSGQRVRTYLPVKALKAKYHSFRFTSSQPFGLWIKDIECRVGPWGRSESYTIQRPFGDISRMNGGARI
jgi:hypothetical protein